MKFKCNAGLLLEAVNRVTATVDSAAGKGSGKTGSISCSKLFMWAKRNTEGTAQVLYLYSTNIVAESFVKIDAEIEVGGETMLDPEQLRAGLSKRNQEETASVELVGDAGVAGSSAKGRRIRVKIGKSSFHISFDAEGTEYMRKNVDKIPFKATPSFSMPGYEMGEFVRRGMFCIPTEDSGTNRYRMGGLNISGRDDGYVALATDGHVAARIRIKGEKKSALNNIVVPQKSLPALNQMIQRRKNEEIHVIEGSRNDRGDISKMFFKMGDAIFGTTLLEGVFPNVDMVLNAQKPNNWILVNRIDLRDALQRAAAFDRDLGHVTLKLEGSILSIYARSEHGELNDSLEVENTTGLETPISVTINMHYLTSIASGSAGETLRVGLNSIKGMAVVVEDTEGENVNSLFALMPIRG